MILSAPRPEWYAQGSGEGPLELRFLGTAGFALQGDQHNLVLDPFLSRPGLLSTGLRRLVPDRSRLQRYIPRADAVLVGHAHFDHALDAPALCQQTGALLVGGPAVGHIGRAAGLPDSQVRVTEGRELLELGRARARGLPSRHGRVYFNRVTLPGDIPSPPPWPPRYYHLKHGLVLNWVVELAGRRVAHIDSADFIDEELAGERVDALCLCAIGRQHRPDYTRRAIELLQPRLVFPCHWDWFFRPYEAEPRLLPGVDLPGFLREIREAGAEPVLLPFEGRYRL
jgi:L-ascorbate metabolism protein UlaG (beta-lactamase superfamily)